MVVIGVDAHKRTHTFAAVDELGRELGYRTFAANPDGHLAALGWARSFPESTFAMEDCRHLTRRLEGDLLRAGEAVLRVSPRLMATARRSGSERGKSDPIDALAVGRAALREPGLPAAQLDSEARRVRLLVDHREDLVRERTRIQCRLRWHLHELLPGLEIPARALRRLSVIADLERRLAGLDGAGGIDRQGATRADARAHGTGERARAGDHAAGSAHGAPGARAARVRSTVGRQAHR